MTELERLRQKVKEAEAAYKDDSWADLEAAFSALHVEDTRYKASIKIRAKIELQRARLDLKTEESRLAKEGLEGMATLLDAEGEGDKCDCCKHSAYRIRALITEVWPEGAQDESKD